MITAADAPLLLVLAAIVRRGSFSAAASELRLSKSIVSERIRQLEERCGVKLLERTTRRLRLTDAGAEVLAAATRLEDVLGQLSSSLDVRRDEPTGTLRVSTTGDLGASLIAPAAARFVTAYPRATVEILSDDGRRDLLDARVDIAVRLGAPKGASFIVRKLATVDEPIVAAPPLAERLGHAARPRDLADAPWVRHALVSSGPMTFVGPGKVQETIVPNVRAEANSGPTVVGLLLGGAGVGVMPHHTLREHLHAGRLARLCPGWIWKSVTLFALMPAGSPQRPAVRSFLAMVQDQIALDGARWGSAAS